MSDEPWEKKDVIVIGGGIVGLATAEKLSSLGKSVTLIEKEKIAAGASFGNAGGFAFSDIIPLASPGVILKAMKWFLDPLGPFAVVPQDLPRTLPWLLRFLYSARPAQFKRSIQVQASLMHLAQRTMGEMLDRTNLTQMANSGGALHVFESDQEFKKELKNWQYRTQHDIAFDCLDKDQLHHFQPGLSSNFVAGIFVPQWQSVSNPNDFCQAIHQTITERGIETIYGPVQSIKATESSACVSLQTGESYEAAHIVVAAGPWSSTLTAQLGDSIPLIGERGYNTTFPKLALELNRTLVFGGHGFVITPLADGIRVGGASEIARLGRAENFKRTKAMVAKAQQFVPALNTNDGIEWMGARPSIPDTLPVISHSTRSKNIIYAFGHGHLGLTQSAATGQLVADLITETPPSIDITALRANRF